MPNKTKQEVAQYSWDNENTTGFENTRQEDLGIPFLTIIQKGSPEIDTDHKDYPSKKLEGVKVGSIIDSQSREILWVDDKDDPVQFIACSHIKLYQEWRPKNQGGGFVRSHADQAILADCKRNDKNQDILPNGNEIQTTSYFYGTYWDEAGEEWKRAIIGMTSTQLKKARKWLNKMSALKVNGKTPPMFSHVYSLITVPESNDKGSWKGWGIEVNRILTMQDSEIIDTARQISQKAMQDNLLPAPTQQDEGNEPY
jgi:hypothetical protein